MVAGARLPRARPAGDAQAPRGRPRDRRNRPSSSSRRRPCCRCRVRPSIRVQPPRSQRDRLRECDWYRRPLRGEERAFRESGDRAAGGRMRIYPARAGSRSRSCCVRPIRRARVRHQAAAGRARFAGWARASPRPTRRRNRRTRRSWRDTRIAVVTWRRVPGARARRGDCARAGRAGRHWRAARGGRSAPPGRRASRENRRHQGRPGSARRLSPRAPDRSSARGPRPDSAAAAPAGRGARCRRSR